MANRIGRLTGFGGQPESRTGFQSLCCDERTGRARGARVGTSRRSKHAPILRDRRLLEALLFPHLVANTSSAIAIEISAKERV